MRLLASLTALAVAACAAPPPPAPEGLDDNMRWWWSYGDVLTDAELVAAADKLRQAAEADTRTMVLKSQVSRLEKPHLEVVGLADEKEPANARGLLVLNVYPCTLDKLEAILTNPDQASLYPGVYERYARTYTTDAAAFREGRATSLAWDTDIKTSYPVSDFFTLNSKGRLRRVPAPADGPTKGRMYVARVWLPTPARFEDVNSASYYKQDYQLEVYWEREPGRIFHAYGMWREMKVGGFGYTLDNNTMMGIVLDNLVKWDDATAQLCAKP